MRLFQLSPLIHNKTINKIIKTGRNQFRRPLAVPLIKLLMPAKISSTGQNLKIKLQLISKHNKSKLRKISKAPSTTQNKPQLIFFEFILVLILFCIGIQHTNTNRN